MVGLIVLRRMLLMFIGIGGRWVLRFFSLLQILEHEMLHAVLALRVGLEVSSKLDNVHRSVFVLLEEKGKKGVFVNELRNGEEWVFPPYLEEPTQDLLE